MREIIEFLEKKIRKGGIENDQVFANQAMKAVMKILSPWLHRVTMKNIGSILFAGEHGYGIGGLEAAGHCQISSSARGITSKTQAFIGEYSRGLVDRDVRYSVYRYQQLHWAFTRKARWLRIEILYEIKHFADGGRSVENAYFSVKEICLETLVYDGWAHNILNGLSGEIQRVIGHRVKDLQELISLQVHLEFINELVNEIVES